MSRAGPKIYEAPTEYYYIKSKLHRNRVLEIKNALKNYEPRAYIVTAEKKGKEALHQQWYFEDAGDGFIHIISRFNRLVFDIRKGSTDAGTRVQTYSFNCAPRNVACQKWKLEDGGLYIRAQLNDQVLTVKRASTNVGANIIMEHKNCARFSNSQQWEIVPCSDNQECQTTKFTETETEISADGDDETKQRDDTPSEQPMFLQVDLEHTSSVRLNIQTTTGTPNGADTTAAQNDSDHAAGQDYDLIELGDSDEDVPGGQLLLSMSMQAGGQFQY